MRVLIGIIVGVLASASIAGAATRFDLIKLHYHDLVHYGQDDVGVGCFAERAGTLACVPDAERGYACSISPKHLGVFVFGPRGVGDKPLLWRSQP